MKVGFTGTRTGLTPAQHEVLFRVLSGLMPLSEAHDGDCVGADTEFHHLVASFSPRPKLIGHPPSNSILRAFNLYDVLHPEIPYMARNHNIVNSVDTMVATPREYEPVIRGSGTWATIRYAWQRRKSIEVIFPDGSIKTGAQIYGGVTLIE